jgi:glutamine---fructose-6-phosphate transaminase (isomerizing)
MCGIIGAIAQQDILEDIISGLGHLAYRGYDSSGIAWIHQDQLSVVKAAGKLCNLKKKIKESSLKGNVVLGHTRWATHGEPSIENAHPQVSGDKIAVVHNGIIENYQEIKFKLESLGYCFLSQTDTEVIAHLLDYEYKKAGDLLLAMKELRKLLLGRYAFAIIHKDYPNHMFALCNGSPLVIGVGSACRFLASDAHAISDFVDSIMYCEEGDIVKLSSQDNYILDKDNNRVDRVFMPSCESVADYNKGTYRYYMEKEIHEQAEIIDHMINYFFKGHDIEPIFDPEIPCNTVRSIENIHFVACGSSYNAACIASYWFESITKVSTYVEVASEYRYRDIIVPKNTLLIVLSQSGETADTIASTEKAKSLNYISIVGLVNEIHSTLVRLCDYVCHMQAGIEIAVASTKTFTAQLFSLLSIAIRFAKIQGKSIDVNYVKELKRLPEKIKEVMALDNHIKQIAWDLKGMSQIVLMGRNVSYPLINEAALKLKEIAYMHAHGYALGELKHGTMALIRNDLASLISLINNQAYNKAISNIHEIHARKGIIIIFADHNCPDIPIPDITRIDIPSDNPMLSPILHAIAFQLLAYHLAVFRGNDVDFPRNLAKCVSVE